ncbi:ATP-binding protein [Methanoregula sp.]|uniref:ATP-binding protein n=1 Tax=Methanoregula sp. TaxID=2052170 RepID=UPI00236D4F72|nr:ATP-binding protein [Methanoregula sp.]MDD1686339.1 ATP-binding protein [Methanoregula sp.]
MILFPVLTIFCLLSAFTAGALGFFVYAQNTKSLVNRLFLASMLGGMYWALGEFFIWYTGSYEGTLFWLKASSFWPVVIVITVHFVLVYTKNAFAQRERLPYLIVFLYLPAFFFSLLGLFTNTIFYVVNMPGTGYIYRSDIHSLAHMAVSVFVLLALFFAILAVYQAWTRAESEKKRRQVGLICIALATAIAFGSISGAILPIFGIYLPNTVFIGFFLFALIITYAINRYDLFTLSAETALPDILRTMPDGLVLIAMNGGVIKVNESAARIFRTDENRMAGQQFSRFLPEPECGNLMTTLQEQGALTDFESVIDPTENTVVSIAGSLVKDPAGEPVGVVLIIRDISNRKMQERALTVANEKISLLTQLTRHDINNLVTGLSGYLLLLEEFNTTSPGKEYLRTSIDLVEKITRHLRFSSEYLYIGTYHPDWQELETLVAHAVNDLPHENVTITRTIIPAEIYADPLSVKVLYNLLENALRHGGNLTAITLAAAVQKSGELLITVEDNGTGVPDADKERIFKYGVGANTGFGLAFARDILEVTGITIRETGIAGKGARFEIHVPPAAWRRI